MTQKWLKFSDLHYIIPDYIEYSVYFGMNLVVLMDFRAWKLCRMVEWPQWRHLYGWQQSHGKTMAASRNSHCCGAVIKQKTHTKIQCASESFCCHVMVLQDHIGAGYACLITKRLVPLICYFLFMSLGKSATGTGANLLCIISAWQVVSCWHYQVYVLTLLTMLSPKPGKPNHPNQQFKLVVQTLGFFTSRKRAR